VSTTVQAPQRTSWWTGAAAIILVFAAVKLLLHFVTANGYGYFRDELYFIVCGGRLDWGYVDHPPLAPLAARVGRAIFGENLFGLRFFPAVSGAIALALTGLMARELGGRRFAIALACLGYLAAPVYLASQSKLATDSIEPAFWAACLYMLVRIIREQNPRLWVWFAVFAGLGVQTKHSIVFFGVAVLVAFLLVPERRLMWNRWFAIAALAALIIALPNLIWQMQHGFPTYELLSNISHSNKNVVLGPLAYAGQQLLLIGPLSWPIWLTGLIALLMGKLGREYRVFGVTYLVLLLLMIVLKGKSYYLTPIYPILLAAGAVVVERFTGMRFWWVRFAYPAFIVLAALVFLPYVLPVFSPESFLRYQKRLGFSTPRTERSHTAELPQNYADRFGWDELAENVNRAYQSLPPEDRNKTGIFAQNYGEAGAIDVLGKKYGLPPALSGHQNYYLWGTHGYTGESLLVVDDNRRSLDQLCTAVEEKGPAIRNRFAMPYEARMNIYHCRGLKQPLDQFWPNVKEWL
jgi:hypothetical protein